MVIEQLEAGRAVAFDYCGAEYRGIVYVWEGRYYIPELPGVPFAFNMKDVARGVENFRFIDESEDIRDIYVGARIKDAEGKTLRVLGHTGQLWFISHVASGDIASNCPYTIEELVSDKYTLIPARKSDEVEVIVDGKRVMISKRSAEAILKGAK